MPELPHSSLLPTAPLHQRYVLVASALLLVLFGVALFTNQIWIAGVPFGLLVAYLCITDFRKIFFLLLFCIPFSIEQELPGGLATDLPDEPLMWLLTAVFGVYAARNWPNMRGEYLRHPLTLLLLLHIAWIFIAIVPSGNVLVSLKFWLSKGWYITVFYFLAGHILREEKDARWFFKMVFGTLTIMILVTLVRHAAKGFAFDEVNYVLSPFYRNHVNYAAIITVFLPFVWWAITWYPRYSKGWWVMVAATALYLVAVQFSYTRAAYVGVVAAFGGIYIVRYRLIKWVLAVGFSAIMLLISDLVRNDKYLEHAPEYRKTITHHRFENLLEATAKGEDISTMERVYRWVAGYHMARTSPWVGFGPGNFYNFYRSYTVTSFKTYVSDNPEHSGIHSYFLMTLVEQGFVGLAIFLLLTAAILLYGERIYHECTDPKRQHLVMAVVLSMIVINCILLINDMIETDKVGPFFFMNIAMLVNADLANRRSQQA